MRGLRRRKVWRYVEWAAGYAAISWALWPALGYRTWAFMLGFGWVGACWIGAAHREVSWRIVHEGGSR